jgi:hypothetical protein
MKRVVFLFITAFFMSIIIVGLLFFVTLTSCFSIVLQVFTVR